MNSAIVFFEDLDLKMKNQNAGIDSLNGEQSLKAI